MKTARDVIKVLSSPFSRAPKRLRSGHINLSLEGRWEMLFRYGVQNLDGDVVSDGSGPVDSAVLLLLSMDVISILIRCMYAFLFLPLCTTISFEASRVK